MTWLPVEAGSQPERDAVLGLKPGPYAGLREILGISWQMTDPALLDLCRLRLAQLAKARAELAGVDERRLADLEDWDTSPAFGDRERAALSFTEQYQLDHHGVTDEQKDELADQLTRRGMVNFVWALHMNDAYIRSLSLLDIAPDPAAVSRPERGASTREEGSRNGETPVSANGDSDGKADLRDPAFVDAYSRLGSATARESLVDEVTSEAVRLRNATVQGCQY